VSPLNLILPPTALLEIVGAVILIRLAPGSFAAPGSLASDSVALGSDRVKSRILRSAMSSSAHRAQ